MSAGPIVDAVAPSGYPSHGPADARTDTGRRLARVLPIPHRAPERSAQPEKWAQAFRQDWGVAKPNNGFLIRDQGRIVGGIGAIYAERLIRGRPERFCNITSWCVLEAYRAQSMRLAMAVVSQPGFHFTDLTPTEVVSKTLQFLKFKPMNERHAVWPNFPWPFSRLWRHARHRRSRRIEAVLAAADAKVFRDHRHLPWLRHARRGPAGGLLLRGLEAEPIERRGGGDGVGDERRGVVPALPTCPRRASAAAWTPLHACRVAPAATVAAAVARSWPGTATRCFAATH